MLRFLAAAGILATSVGSARAADLVSSTTPYTGVTHLVYADSSIPARIHVVIVDLSSAEISLQATAESDRGHKVSEFSAISGAQVVINGDLFSPADFRPAGLAMGGAALWTGSTDDDVSGFIGFDRNGNRSNVAISPPSDVVAAADLPAGTQGVVGGRPMIVRAGVAQTSFDCSDTLAMPCLRAPRTAVAVDDTGNTLMLVVVDGWQIDSLGMTAAELGTMLAGIGAHDALMLDGGGSSVLYIAGEAGIVSSPSDGVERVVANHLGVHFGALPPGQMIGFVRDSDVFDSSKNLVGATVELDDGRQLTTDSGAMYNFSNVSPRYACVTASMPGYHTATRCQQVTSGQLVYNSIALYPNSLFVDAGPGAPDAGLPADASPAAADAAMLADAGDDDAGMGGGGGGCAASGGTGAAFALVLLLLARRVQRRTRSS